jgi:nitrile hydratase
MGGDHHIDSETSQRVRDLEERLVQAGVLEGEEVDDALDRYLANRGVVTNGARLVARAWLDEDFRDRLLADGNAACRELGLEWAGEEPIFKVVANGPELHNVIVCTLCSCYPTGLLGP